MSILYIYKNDMRKQAVVHKIKQVIVYKEKVRIEHLLYEVLTETTLAQPIVSSLPLVLLHISSSRYQL